jgi:hypothetical protein
VNLSDFKIGDLVIVNPNTKDLDLGIDIGGWQGRVKEISERYDSIIVAWDSLTLKQMPGEAIDKCEEDGLDWQTYGLSPQDVALTSPRDHADDAEDAIRLLESKHGWSYLGEEGKRIQAVLARVDNDDEWAALEAWEAYFEQTLTFPFEAEVSECQDRGPLRTGEKVRVLGIEGSEDPYGVLVSLRRKRQRFVFPLCDLEAVDISSLNYEPVKDYAVWYANR